VLRFTAPLLALDLETAAEILAEWPPLR
jgi:hypothetical protein